MEQKTVQVLMYQGPLVGNRAFFERFASECIYDEREVWDKYRRAEDGETVHFEYKTPLVDDKYLSPKECLRRLLNDGSTLKEMTIGRVFWEAFDCEGYYCAGEGYFADNDGNMKRLTPETTDEFLTLYWKEPSMHS